MSYILPFKPSKKIRICDAPFHKEMKNMSHCIDFSMPEGTPILAIDSGMVTRCETRFSKNYKDKKGVGKANKIAVLHGNGETSLYVHLKWRSARFHKDAKVKKGQVIALSGETGYATYPHLHFGIFDRNGKNIRAVFKK